MPLIQSLAASLLLLTPTAAPDDAAATEALAGQFAALAQACIQQEYPNQIRHYLLSDDDVLPPRQLTPAFYGCFDWHSAVHGHWLLVRLLRTHPDADFAATARAGLSTNLNAANLLAEAAYMAHPDRSGFERPYGLAWLLQLVAELDAFDDPDAQRWREQLRPLEVIAVQRLHSWIPKLRYPIRGGEHFQTAFAFGLIWDYAEQVADTDLQTLLRTAGEAHYGKDLDCPLAYEPSGHDFLSPCLAEADFMRRLLPPAAFAHWLDTFLPTLTQRDALPVAEVSDRADGKLAHIDGLNLSRAWMLEGIAAGLPAADTRRSQLQAMADAHASAGLAGVSDTHYAGSHWLASFAVYLRSQRGINTQQ